MDARRRAGSAVSETSAENVLGLLSKITRVGGRPEDILGRAGAPFSLSDLSDGTIACVKRADLIAIYRECIVAIGWHSSQLDHRPRMHPDEFRLMCQCVINCRSFGDVIQRQIAFFSTRGERMSHLALTVDARTATVTMDTMRRRKNFVTFLSDLAGLSIFTRFYAWLIGMSAHHFRAGLAYGQSYAGEPVADLFKGELAFDCATNTISFPRAFLTMPVVRNLSELDQLLVEFPFDFLSSTAHDAALHDRIRAIYGISLARGDTLPSLAELARLTGRSVSTIRRYLDDEALTIRALKTAARRDAAIDLLKQRRKSIDDVAYGAGFRDTNTFRQQFKQWTGMSPSEYRKSLIHHAHGNQG